MCLLVLGVVVLAGCSTTRSISHSEYRESTRGYFPRPNESDPGFEYKGELSEFDVLGITPGETASESEIRQALNSSKRVTLRPGDSILLVQSGAMFPDGGMVTNLSKHFRVVPFSGVPRTPTMKDATRNRIQNRCDLRQRTVAVTLLSVTGAFWNLRRKISLGGPFLGCRS